MPIYTVFKVKDTGIGLSPQHLTKIFEPFFTTKPIGQGTGLGLSIVYKIIEKHAGTISVESEQGKGTTFTITLPIQFKSN
jgi:signal transduction histidine kinase